MSVYRSFQQIQSKLLLTKKESSLIRLLFQKAPSQSEQELYQDLVFDDEKQSFLLLLARLAQRSDYACTPAPLIPRLKGLLRYHSVNNKLVLQPAVTLLDTAGASPLMLYGNSAMYGYYDGENPRLMGIGDVYVPPERVQALLDSAQATGFQVHAESSLATCLKNQLGNVNVHKLVHLQADAQIWQRSRQVQFQNRPVRVADCADALILLLRSEFRWWCIQNRQASNIKWYYDCACLLQHPDFPGFATLTTRAMELGSGQTVRFMLSLFDNALPGWLPEGFLETLPKFNKKQIALAVQYGSALARYDAGKAVSRIKQVICWPAMIRTKYHYLNSEISYSAQQLSPIQMLRQHFGVARLTQLPALFRSRRKAKAERRGQI